MKVCNFIYTSCCLLASMMMIFVCLMKFRMNESTVSMQYKQFHATKEDSYPSFTICFSSVDVPPWLGPFVDFNGLPGANIAKMVRGHKDMNPEIKKAEYDDFTINIQDILKLFLIKDNLGNTSTIFNSEKMKNKVPFIVHGDAFIKCFSHNIEYKKETQIRSIQLNLRNMTIVSEFGISIFFHHPGQLLRNGRHPVYEKPMADIVRMSGITGLYFSIHDLTLLKKRKDGRSKCNEESKEDDKVVIKEVAERFNCSPMLPNFPVQSPPCSDKSDLETASDILRRKIMRSESYLPELGPCDTMLTTVTVLEDKPFRSRTSDFKIVFNFPGYFKVTKEKRVLL